jgi:hypothetical protein
MRKIIVFMMVFLVFSIFSMDVCAYYNFLSDDANIGLNILKEKYSDVLDAKEEYCDYGFIWGVIFPENEGKEVREYSEIIEGKKYTITEITIIKPQGPIKIVWGSASKNNPYDVPKIIVR